MSKVDSVQVVRVRASRISETFQSDGNEDPLAVRWVLASSWSSMATATSVPFAGTVRGGWDHQLRWGCYRGFPENGTFNEASVSRNWRNITPQIRGMNQKFGVALISWMTNLISCMDSQTFQQRKGEQNWNTEKRDGQNPYDLCMVLFTYNWSIFIQLLVNWWFGLVVWIPGTPLWKGLLLRGTPRFPDHQPKPSI